MDFFTLTQAIQDLARIDAAGLLPDLQNDLAADHRGWPRSDLDRYPLRALMVRQIAMYAADLFALPVADCEDAAAEALLPNTRERQVLNTISRYMTRLSVETSEEPSATDTATDDAAIARARKRRRA